MATPTPPSSSLPQPLSYEQILGNSLSSYAATFGVNDFNVGGAMVSFMQIAALMTARASGDIFQILRDYSLDRATGPALQNLAIEYGVPPLGAAVATSFVTVVDLSFQKIATKIYAGANPPIAGSVTVYVSDASLFPATGAVYLGRGSVNVEGPISYSAKTQIGSFWSLTLSSPTTKFHNISESVILSQGGVRTVPVNTIVISPGIGTTSNIQYSVTQNGIILDGETTATNIPITALLPGADGNVPGGAVSQFSGNPSGLPNASVTNPSAITTGRSTETDNQLRVRVKNKLASTGLGTVTAIESSLQGVQSPTSSDTIVSTDVLNSSSNTIVYVDNGAGYEATHAGVPIETIVNSALGGEKFFQLVTGGKQTSVTKALLQTITFQPFALSGGEVLAVIVGEITYDHSFLATDFANPGSATAYEICASINANTTINFEAVTAGNGAYVVIRPEDETTNVIQITTPSDTSKTDANTILQFPSQKAETLRLYKNGELLIEDGTTASIFTQQQSFWSPTLASGETLSISVDGTNPITYTLTDADFVAEGTYPSLSSSNSLQSWVNVLNNVVTGITASIVGSEIEITSNLGAINRAQIQIVNTIANPTSLIAKGVISNNDLSSMGAVSDYKLDRNTAEIQLASALIANDSLSAGTLITQANIESGVIPSGSVTLTSDAHVWISIDVNAVIIPTILSGSTLTVSKIGSNTVRYTSNSTSSFANAIPGDYVIVWSNELTNSNNRLEGRVHAKTGSTLDIKVTAAEYALASAESVSFIEGFVVVRTENVPQKFRVQSGTKTLEVIAAELQAQTDELVFGVFDDTNITVVTNTYDVIGQITVVTADTSGALMGFSGGVNSVSQDALIAFYETQSDAAELPLFFHSTISADSYANPIDTYLTNFSSTQSLSAFDPNELIQFLNPYSIYPSSSGTLTKVTGTGDTTITFSSQSVSSAPNQYTFIITAANATAGAVYSNNGQLFTVKTTIVSGTSVILTSSGLIDDEQPAEENVQMSAVSGTAVTILPKYPDVRRLRVADRFYVANPLDFGYNDTVVAIVDNNAIGETYTLPLYRRSIVNSIYPANNFSFNAYDVDAGPTASFATNFPNFDFSNFKALMQAKYVLQGSNTQTALLYRSVLWGRSGEDVNVSYVYPTAANRPINSVVTVTSANKVSIKISLISGNPVSSLTSSNTQWNVTVTANTPSAGIDQVTYTYNGTGTAPGLTLSGGEYVTILPSTGFNVRNTGTFRVSTAIGFTPTSTQFSVQVPTGTAFVQSNVVTSILNGINFYLATPTSAAAINTYVNANLSQYVTTAIVNDGGMTGSGILVLSTYEDSGFTNPFYYLKDGINWIASSNVNGSPQFTLKVALTYPSDTGYSFFTSGDEVRLIPTTMDQVQRLWSILAVTGFTTVGTIEVVDRGKKLQLATNTVGSAGSVQIVGGTGNEYTVPVLTSGELIGINQMMISANSVASHAVSSDQWFRLQAQNYQNKNAGFASNTSVTVVSNSPISGQSTITLLNKNSSQLYFGAPRNFTTVSGRTFRVEKQGSLACLSWNGVGSSPNFSIAANLNDSGGWTVNVSPSGIYTVATGATNFSALSIGDLIVVSGLTNAGNNGTFFIESVSATSFGVSNPLAVTETGTAVAGGQFSSTLSVSEGDTVILATPFSPLNQGTYRVIRMNNNSIWYENINAIEEEVVCTSNSQIQFYPYEATVPGDKLVINGTVLGAGNSGTYNIVQVTSPTVIVVSGIISSQVATNLAGNSASLSVEEGTKYNGYKQVSYVVFQPGTSNFNDIVFNTSAQYEKIDLSGGVALTSLGKMDFPTTVRTGLDSYNYDTGLIGEANRVVYGDPRDPITYAGISAAGCNIFIREPLLRRVQIALAIRTNIGISFAQITSQIQSSVYALILSNPLGQSIDLSSIVETVRLINGVTSVVLTNPIYNVANDEIKLVTGEKAFIVNQNTDISVQLIGS